MQSKQPVAVDGAMSMQTLVASGVHQGSVLGPLLSLIYINKISEVGLSFHSRSVLYADDFLLYRPVSHSADYFLALQAT